MLITFTGDVTEVRPGYGTPTSKRMTLTDRTSGLAVSVVCAGELLKVADEVKVGQVMQVVGWTNKMGAASLSVIPFVLRAQSGTNEATINSMTAQYTVSLLDNKTSALQAEVDRLKAANATLDTLLIDERRNKEIAVQTGVDLTTENARLRATLEETDRQLQYERLVKETVE